MNQQETPESYVKRAKAEIAERTKHQKKQIHNSGLEKYFRCAQDFYLSIVRKLPTPRGTSLLVGSAVDESITKNMQNVIDFQEMLTLEQVLEIASFSIKVSFEVEVHLKEGKAGECEKDLGRDVVRAATIDKAVRLARLHYTEFAPKLKPIKSQWKWALKNLAGFEKYSFVGAVDLVVEGPIIIDNKTAAKSPVKDIIDISTQMSTYAMAYQLYEGVIPGVQLDFLIDNKKPIVKSCPGTRDEEDFQIVLNRFKIFIESYEKGVFPPVSADHWICHPNFCGHFNENCKYALRRKKREEAA